MKNQDKKFKEGDTVWSLTKGEGRVILDNYGNEGLITVQFCNGDTYDYYEDGKYYAADLFPEIYHTRPEITIPKRKVKREVKRWIIKKDNPEKIGIENIDPTWVKDHHQITITWEEEID